MTAAATRRTSERTREALALAARLAVLGVPRWLAAAAAGVDQTTLDRWRRRARQHQPLVRQRGPQLTLNVEAEAQGAELVRALGGQVGAESLRRSVPGLSRRRAAAVKRQVCRTLERERRQQAQRITVTTPDVVRGFDAMHLPAGALLVAADGSVPYRTTWAAVDHYDGAAVAALLDRDIARHGAPLIYRMDRARQHDTAAVREVLARHQVLVLHGPPHHPRYYGQLERQNREHRAWLAGAGRRTEGDPDSQITAMMSALNSRWKRRTLGWRTAREVWEARALLNIDRSQLSEEVARETESLRHTLALRGGPVDLPNRLAIEHALSRRGLLRRESGGWC